MNDLPNLLGSVEASGTSHPWSAERTGEAAMVDAAGLFDAGFYLANHPDVAQSGADPLDHFLQQGWREGRQPNVYFHPDFYTRQNPELERAGLNPLLHYILAGEAEGRPPSPYFDLAWYRARHAPAPGGTWLRHFLERRRDGVVSPLPEFDARYYLATYADIRRAGVDPCEHYLLYGYREGRNPSAEFDTRYYLHRYLDGELALNPLLHYRQFRHVLRLHPRPPPHETTIYREVERNTRPGPDFERRAPLPRTARRQAKVLAYYLPQFHAIPENDRWWGAGFTEWTSVARGLPRFVGQYQPRTPRDLGHYTLGGPEIMRRQIDMARDAGLFGFVQYFYWFNGRRLLERPLETFLADDTLDFPFCLMWTNENWTRRWDGSEHEVLISQDYRAGDDAALVDEFARHFADRRYIRIEGRPVLMIYRPRLIPETAATVARWRRMFAERHGEAPILVMAQSFDDDDPRPHGLDGAIEFPPHKLTVGLELRNVHLTYLDPRANGQVFAYDDVVAASLAEPAPPFPLIKTAAPGWDNDARRQGAGLALAGASPARYQAWLSGLVARSAEHDFMGERFVCVNAWNEWAEGTYLEPDVHYGSAYLNATARAVTGLDAAAATGPLLLVGHDAFPAGAQMLLLHLGRQFLRGHGAPVEFALLGDGALLAEYEAVAPSRLVTSPGALAEYAARGVTHAVVNSCAAAWAVRPLAQAGVRVLLLVHEMPRLIEERGLLAAAQDAAEAASEIVFAAAAVRDGLASLVRLDAAKCRVLPQGCYGAVAFDPAARACRRQALGLSRDTRLVVGAGYGDLRKGFDLFLQAWRAAARLGMRARFVWLGDLDPTMRTYLAPEIDAATATGGFAMPGRQPVADWLAAADAFALTSREDPYPTVVLEALCAGLPVVAFAGGGGGAEMLREREDAAVVDMADCDAMARAIEALTGRRRSAAERARAAACAAEATRFDRYAAVILHAAAPALATISVAVLSFNYVRYLPGRLGSVFAQSHPVAEVLLLDDASGDDSVDRARAIAADWSRDLRVVANERNGGSVFAQWQRAAREARGDWLWIAEADDEADPTMLARLTDLAASAEDIDMAICDSRSIDADGHAIWPDYQGYYAQAGAPELRHSGLFAGPEFARRFLAERNLVLNVSAVLWRRTALLAALDRCGPELRHFRTAGDWRVYVELMTGGTGSVAWLAEPRNVHRRHEASASRTQPTADLLREVARMHAVTRRKLKLDAGARARQAAYRRELAAELAQA